MTILEPSPEIYTPSRLYYVLGYSLQRLSLEDTAAGLPRRIEAVGTRAEPIVFEFADNDAVGAPLSGDFTQRLIMVDAEGWAAAADPAYYDLHPGDGSLYRFSAARHLPGYLSLVLHRNAQGREETLQSLDTDFVFDAERNLRQVLAPSCLADITVLPETAEGFTITFYHRDDVPAQPNNLGIYIPVAGAKPFTAWTFDNPDFLPPDPNAPGQNPPAPTRLRVTKAIGTHTDESLFTYTADSDAWGLVKGGGLINKIAANSWSDGGNAFIEEKYTLASDGVTRLDTRANQYELIGGIYRIVKDIKDPEGDAFSINYSYHTDKATDGVNFGRIRSVTKSDGSWRVHDYDAAGNAIMITSGWLDAPFGAVASQTVATTYSYDAILPADILNSAFTKNDRRPRVLTKSVCDIPVSRTHYAYTRNGAGEAVEIESRAASPADAPFAAGSLATTRTYYAPGAAASSGLLKSVEYPDGRTEAHTYERGNYTAHADPAQCVFIPDPAGKAWRHTVTHGTVQDSNGIPGRTLRTAEVLDRSGNLVLAEMQVCAAAGAFETVSRTASTYDRQNRKTRTASTDGTSEDYVWGDNCCGMASRRAADGTETVYEYDAAGRLVAETRTDMDGIPALRTAYTLDAAGRRVRTVLSNISGNAALFPALPQDVAARLPQDFQLHTSIELSRQVYSDSGTLLSSTDAQGRVTVYQSSEFGKVSVISPGGLLTNVTVRHADGQVAYTEENGGRTATYAYGVNAGGTRWTLSAQGGYDPAQPYTALDVPWSRATRDFLGRPLTTERPGFGGTVLISSNAYDTASRLTSEAQLLTINSSLLTNAITLYAYDALSRRTLTALDLDLDGVIDLAGPDRVQGAFSYYTKLGNDWAEVSGSVSYPSEGSAQPVTNTLMYAWLTGLGQTPPSALFAAHGITLPPTAVLTSKGEVHTLTASGEYAVAAASYTVLDPATRSAWQISVSPTDGASATKDLNGLTVSTARYPVPDPNATPPLPTPNSELRTSSFSYDPLGRQVCAFSPSSANRLTAVFTQHNAKGQVAWWQDASGARTSYTYDPTGHRATAADALGQVTHTVYNAKARLTATWGAAYPVAYAYDMWGRMTAMATTRHDTPESLAQILEFASAGHCQLTTSHYPLLDQTAWLHDNPTGLLTNKVYADGHGPAYAYTPNGRLATRTWVRGIVTTYSYDTSGSLTSTAYSDGTPGIALTYDRLGRQASATDAAGLTVFAYDLPGNLTGETTVAHGVPPCALTHFFDGYGRPTGYALDGVRKTTLGYSPLDGRLETMRVADGTEAFTWAYLPGSTLKQTVDYPNGVQVSYAYEQHHNLLTQVKNALGSRTVSTYGYTNDAIGRRTQMNYLGEAFAVPDQITYGYNPRSELTNAVAQADAAYRFAYEYDPIGNRVKSSDGILAVETAYQANPLNQYASIASNLVNPVNPVQNNFTPLFDPDGNQTLIRTTTGIWHVTYNGENRPAAWSNDASGLLITMAYDRMGRRTAYNALGESKRFTYNGHTLIREIKNGNTISEYVWDPTEPVATKPLCQISLTLSSLLPTTYYLTHDGNKNVSALLDGAGTLIDGYTYTPFGLIAASLQASPATPFRFSSEYHDDALGLVYYNWRHYNPMEGRWFSRDPIGERGGKNLYRFSRNKPLALIDVRGLFVQNEACERAKRELPGIGEDNAGGIICDEKGQIHACVYDDGSEVRDDTAREWVLECTRQHELQHAEDADPCSEKCPELWSARITSLGRSEYECRAYIVSVECLEAAMDYCGGNEVCESEIKRKLDFARGTRDNFCRHRKEKGEL